MNQNAQTTPLKVKLSEELLREFKSRVAARDMARDEYAVVALHYALQDDDGLADLQPNAATPAPDIYLSVQAPTALRRSLTQWSDRLCYNTASFCGLLLGRHFKRHARDPRELVILHHIDRALTDDGELAESDLRGILERHGAQLLAGVSPAFMANWFFNRFRSRITRIKSDDAEVSFSADFVKNLLGKLAPPR